MLQDFIKFPHSSILVVGILKRNVFSAFALSFKFLNYYGSVVIVFIRHKCLKKTPDINIHFNLNPLSFF